MSSVIRLPGVPPRGRTQTPGPGRRCGPTEDLDRLRNLAEMLMYRHELPAGQARSALTSFRRLTADERPTPLVGHDVMTERPKDSAWDFVALGRGHDTDFWAGFPAALYGVSPGSVACRVGAERLLQAPDHGHRSAGIASRSPEQSWWDLSAGRLADDSEGREGHHHDTAVGSEPGRNDRPGTSCRAAPGPW